ncbi:MAG: DUF6348 family protein [Zoogloeaceae bacterium]|nr:DUF6348 family protein [Zoogloeaceae bacterium]
MEHIKSLLEETFRAHGVEAARADGSFFAPNGLRLTPLARETISAQNDHIITLEILVESPLLNGKFISECFAGIAKTREEAIRQAYEKFLLGAFHVFLESLTDRDCAEPQTKAERWIGQSGSWNVFSGPLLITQRAGKSRLTPVYSLALPELRRKFEQTQLANPHWVRVFVAACNGGIQAVEVLLDNESWPEGFEIVSRQDWRPGSEYQSLRHFFLALPFGQTEQSGASLGSHIGHHQT